MWSEVENLEAPKRRRVTALAVSTDGTRLVMGDRNGNVNLYNVETDGWMGYWPHDWAVTEVAISDNNAAIVSIAEGRVGARKKSELAYWRIEDDKERVWKNRPGLRYHCPRFLNGDSTFVAKHGSVRIYDAVTGGNGKSIREQGTGNMFAISPNGKQLVLATEYAPLHVWSVTGEANRLERELQDHHCADVQHIAFSGDGSLLVTLDNEGRLRIYDFKKRNLRAEGLVQFDGDALCCGWISSLHGWVLVDKTSQTWQLTTDGEMQPLGDPCQDRGATSAAICSGSELVAVGSQYGKISIRQIEAIPAQAEPKRKH